MCSGFFSLSFRNDNIDIVLNTVKKKTTTRRQNYSKDNTEKTSLQNRLNEMFFDIASPVLIINFQRTTHDETKKNADGVV